MTDPQPPKTAKPKGPNMFGLLKEYRTWILGLVILAMLGNGLSLILPTLIARGIDAFAAGTIDLRRITLEFTVVSLLIFGFTYLQNIVQTYTSEKVAKDLREKVSAKISRQSFAFVQTTTPAKLLTNLTSDIDAVKMFVAQAIASIISSLLLIVGSATLLLLINWRLALAVLTIIPIIAGTFGFVLSRVRKLFKVTQEVIDWLNKVINESILGAALIRVINAQHLEYEKFVLANTEAKNTGMKILRMFSAMIPIVTLVSNLAVLIVLLLGGHFVIGGSMSLGDFAAFNSYIAIFIFPIFVIGFMSNVLARAQASFVRVAEILDAPEEKPAGTLRADLRGDVTIENVSVRYGEQYALKDVSFTLKAGTKTAIIGPTGAGKTQLLNILTGLMRPEKGAVLFDGHAIDDYDPQSLYTQMGLVFQDSVLFNMSVRENIAFSSAVTDADLAKAVETAELKDFIDSLSQGLSTVVSERGTSLSGGQKQRIMLARALAVNPKILLLDDFTARVDGATEAKILANIERNYPKLTLLSVTQKIDPIKDYDQIVLLMEGEMLAKGTHEHLMHTSPEYVQIFDSQRSTNTL